MDSESFPDSATESSVESSAESSKSMNHQWVQGHSVPWETKDSAVLRKRCPDLLISKRRRRNRPERSVGKRVLEDKVCRPRETSVMKGKTRQDELNSKGEVGLKYLGEKEEESDRFPPISCRYSGERKSGVISKFEDRNRGLWESLTIELTNKLKERRRRIIMAEIGGETKESVSKDTKIPVFTSLTPEVDVKKGGEAMTTTGIPSPPPMPRFLPDGYNSATHLFANPRFITFRTDVGSVASQLARTDVGSVASQLAQIDIGSVPSQLARTDVGSVPSQLARMDLGTVSSQLATADVGSLPSQFARTDVGLVPSQLAQPTYQTSSDESSSSLSPIWPRRLPSKPQPTLERSTITNTFGKRGGFRRWRSEMDGRLGGGGKQVFLRKSCRERKKEKNTFKRSFQYRSLPQSCYKNWILRRTEGVHERDYLKTTSNSEWSDVEAPMQSLGIGTMEFPQYECLESISLCHSNLKTFPDRLFQIKNLRLLDLSWNNLSELPTNLNRIPRLEVLDVSHNRIKAVVNVAGLTLLRRLNLSFNVIEQFPRLAPCINFLTVMELDVSDNGITSFDVSTLPFLTCLKCSNNAIVTISLHGATLHTLIASNNCLTSVRVKSHPRKLRYLDLSRNSLGSVPPWLVSCNAVEYCDVSSNVLASLPAYVTSGHLSQLKVLKANSNRLRAVSTLDGLPDHRLSEFERERICSLENLSLHHNQIERLSTNFFQNFPRLFVLNVSSNSLEKFPDALSSTTSRLENAPPLSIQEIYATDNCIEDLPSMEHCRGLKILHMGFNKISSISQSFCSSCESLEELVLSGNNITDLPHAIAKLRRLTVLRIYLNPLRRLPQLSLLPRLQVIDVSHCLLRNVDVGELVGPSLASLDVAFNQSMALNPGQLSKYRCISVVDTTGAKDKSLPLAAHSWRRGEASTCNLQRGEERVVVQAKTKRDGAVPWKIGFSEASGKGEIRLTTTQLRLSDLHGDGRTCLVTVIDGGQHLTSASEVTETFRGTLSEEKLCYPDLNDALRFSVLSSLRQVAIAKGVLPEGLCAAYLTREGPNDVLENRDVVTRLGQRNDHYSLRLCYFGTIYAVVTTSEGTPLVYSSPTQNKLEDSSQGCRSGGGCDGDRFWNLPHPQTKYLPITTHHLSLVIASASLWEFIEPSEANRICQSISDPTLTAKRLLTLAQSYGCNQQLSILVLHLPSMFNRKILHLTKKLDINQQGYGPSKNTTTQFLYSSNPTKRLSKSGVELFTDQSRRITHMDGPDQRPMGGKSGNEDSVPEERRRVGDQGQWKPSGTEKMVEEHLQQETSLENLRTMDLPIGDGVVEYSNTNDRSDASKPPLGLIPPPVGFRDSDSESIASDSGFSGNSGDKVCTSPTKRESLFQEAQSTNSEYIPTKNSKLDYFLQINSLKENRETFLKSSSVPNLVGHLSSDEMFTEYAINCDENSSGKLATHLKMPRHFCKNTRGLRRAWLHAWADKFVHNTANFRNALKVGSISRLCNKPYNFKRFGSLQNLTHYQNIKFWNKQRHFSWQTSREDSETNDEMIEKFPLDLMELESRTPYFGDTEMTCF